MFGQFRQPQSVDDGLWTAVSSVKATRLVYLTIHPTSSTPLQIYHLTFDHKKVLENKFKSVCTNGECCCLSGENRPPIIDMSLSLKRLKVSAPKHSFIEG